MERANAANPFLRFRWMLDSYASARETGWSDDDFVSLVTRLDEAVAAVEGHGFVVTPLVRAGALAGRVGLAGDRLWIKDDTGNVSGSHKARHLFGVLLHLAVEGPDTGELAIASCGNAALAAAVVARAVDRPLRVFIPTWADPAVVTRLEALAARIEVCPRRPGEQGDPTYLRFLEAVDAGAVPFSVQGTVTPSTIDGGRTLGWELAEQLGVAGARGRLRLFVQVGGGALATAVWRGLGDGIREQWLEASPVLHTVQTEACAPLPRAWELLAREAAEYGEIPLPRPAPARATALLEDPDAVDAALEAATAEPERFMWPWEDVGTSEASGILDDTTYDWMPVVEGMLRTGGWPVTVPEADVVEANELARTTGIDVSATGSAGLAALLDAPTLASVSHDDHVVVLFTGASR